MQNVLCANDSHFSAVITLRFDGALHDTGGWSRCSGVLNVAFQKPCRMKVERCGDWACGALARLTLESRGLPSEPASDVINLHVGDFAFNAGEKVIRYKAERSPQRPISLLTLTFEYS